MGFDFAVAFGRPVKVLNDAAMQALGSYQGGKMLFLGLGTGVGAAVVMDEALEPLEIGRFRYRKHTLEYYVGVRGLERQGRKKWQRRVEEVLGRLVAALKPDDVVLGGGNAKKLKPLPAGTRLGDNSFAFLGGFRLWEREAGGPRSTSPDENGALQRGTGDRPSALRPGRASTPSQKEKPQ